jgi:hypothetical protein
MVWWPLLNLMYMYVYRHIQQTAASHHRAEISPVHTRSNCLPSILILLGDWTYPDPYTLSILVQNSRIQPMLQHPIFPSNAKPSKISTLAKHIFLSHLTQQKVIITLPHQHSIPTSSSAPHLLHRYSINSTKQAYLLFHHW